MKEVLTMTKYREILRLSSLGFSNRNIALSVPCSRNTVSKVLKRAKELNLFWPLSDDQTDAVLEQLLYPKLHNRSNRRMPDYDYIRKELLRNGVSKKLLWTEYIEDCRANGDEPLMYSQFCYHIQQDEQKHRATMHIKRKPAEQIEVDWAGDPAMIIDPDTGEIIKAHIFVGVMTYSQYTYVEAFLDMKQRSWIKAHIHMYEYFGGVAKILVPDNCKTAVIHNGKRKDQQINQTYQELAEHYGTAIIPARVRSPKDKPNAEGTVGNISTWITAALRNEQFFSLAELNRAIRKKLLTFNQKLFQKKESSRLELFLENEKPLLSPLPATRFELSDWKTATVQFNYHISVDKMLYSVPFEDRFGMIVDIEYNNRKSNRLKRLIKKAEFDQPDASIMDVDYTSGRKLNKDLITRLATCEYISEHRNIFITGATGCGKTYMACAFGMEACKQYFNTKYVRLPDLLIDLELARDNGNYKKIMAKYANPVLLILDEWLLLKPTESEQRDIFELLHRSRKKSSTIFCSQYEFEEWYDQLGGSDSPLADAILDHIAYDSYWINIRGIDIEHDISMREVYGLDKSLRE